MSNGLEGGSDARVDAVLSINGAPTVEVAAFIPSPSDVVGHYRTTIHCDGVLLETILTTAKANGHAYDPAPDRPGRYVYRHPVYLVGTPTNLPIEDARRIAHTVYPYVSPDAPD